MRLHWAEIQTFEEEGLLGDAGISEFMGCSPWAWDPHLSGWADLSVGRETMGLILHILEKLQNDSAASAGRNYHCWAEKTWLGWYSQKLRANKSLLCPLAFHSLSSDHLELPNVDPTCNAEMFAGSQPRITKQRMEGWVWNRETVT